MIYLYIKKENSQAIATKNIIKNIMNKMYRARIY